MVLGLLKNFNNIYIYHEYPPMSVHVDQLILFNNYIVSMGSMKHNSLICFLLINIRWLLIPCHDKQCYLLV